MMDLREELESWQRMAKHPDCEAFEPRLVLQLIRHVTEELDRLQEYGR